MRINQFDPMITKDDIANLLETLDSNWLTEGPKTAALEELLREATGARHAILVPNGTLALFAALKILGIGPGDEVLVPDFTFVASASAVVLTGAKPVFVEVDLQDFNMSVPALKHAVSERTRAMMPVHIYGQAADMAGVLSFAREHDLRVVEDAAQGMGVTFGDRHVGTLGDIGCVSFFADKTITTGEGGCLLVNDDELADEARYFKNQGRLERGSFIHPRIGFNFRLTGLQAALAIEQMRRLPAIVRQKLEHERLYAEYLEGVEGIEFPPANGRGTRVPFRANILTDDPEALGRYLEARDIGVRRFFYPLHKQPCFNASNSRAKEPLENAEKIFLRGLSLPSSLSLNPNQIRRVCDGIRSFVESSPSTRA